MRFRDPVQSVGIAMVRALFQTTSGIVMGAGFCALLTGVAALLGMGLHVVFDLLGLNWSGFAVAFFVLFCAIGLMAVMCLLIGRFHGVGASEPDLADSAFDLLFKGYGMFVSMLTLAVTLYHAYDASIFREKGVGFWPIAQYCLEITLLGFIPDVLQFKPIQPNLSAAGEMTIIEFAVKLLMAATVISGVSRYMEGRHKIKLLPF